MINKSSEEKEFGNVISNRPEPVKKSKTSPNSHLDTSNKQQNFVVNPQVNPIPPFYPLEQTRTIINGIDLQKIIENLSQCFQALSIQAKCKETGTILLTPEYVKMYLYFWKVDGDKDGILIELQRRKGDTIFFHRYAKYILQAASAGNFSTAENTYNFCLHPNTKRPSEISNTNNEDESLLLRQLESVSNLIQSDRMDTKILGMESLSILTDTRKTKLDVALYVSRAVLVIQNGNQTANNVRMIHEFLMKMVQNQFINSDNKEDFQGLVENSDDDDEYFSEEAVSDDENNDENDVENDGEKPRRFSHIENTLHNFGLIILSNALETLHTFYTAGSTKEAVETQHRINKQVYIAAATTEPIVDQFCEMLLKTQNGILMTLLREIDSSILKPHNAYLAAKCLHFLLLCSSSSKNSRAHVSSITALEMILRAEEIGKATNLRLHQECKNLRLILCDN